MLSFFLLTLAAICVGFSYFLEHANKATAAFNADNAKKRGEGLYVRDNDKTLTPKWLVQGMSWVAILFCAIALNPFITVKTGDIGVKYTFGKINKNPVYPGIHMIIPGVQEVQTVSVKPIVVEQTIPVGDDGAITRDNQTIGAKMNFYYRYKPEQVVRMYSEYGEDKIQSLVAASGTSAFKSEIGSHQIFDLPLNQVNIQMRSLASVRAQVKDLPIEILDLKVLNYSWPDAFDKQVQATSHIAQMVKQKQQELLVAEQEAQKVVKRAEADREALVQKATGEKEAADLRAQAKVLEGEGIRKYNESVSRNFQQELEFRKIQLEFAKVNKWNGAYVANNNYGPIPVQTGVVQGK